MPRKRFNGWLALSVGGGMTYPAFVYFSLDKAPPFLMVAAGLGLIALRLRGMQSSSRNEHHLPWTAAFLLAALALVGLSVVEPHIAVKSYPVLVNLCVATLFGLSLIWPPSMVERFARITEPNLAPDGQRYTRKVTQVWTVFLFANSAVSVITVLYGSKEQWALWNGLISYLLMGTLFAGECALRRTLRRRV